jgi:hypothetical protein
MPLYDIALECLRSTAGALRQLTRMGTIDPRCEHRAICHEPLLTSEPVLTWRDRD